MVVIRGEPIYHDEHNNVVLKPTAIVEVLSPSTEAFDRGEKLIRLRNGIPSLMDCVLISQVEPLIEVFHRTGATTWSLTPATGFLQMRDDRFDRVPPAAERRLRPH